MDSCREFNVVAGPHEQADIAYLQDWTAYNEALKRRGSLTIWFDPEMNWGAKPSGKRGRSRIFSDAAIQTCLTMKVLLWLPPSCKRVPTLLACDRVRSSVRPQGAGLTVRGPVW
jgi:hypothetical protein